MKRIYLSEDKLVIIKEAKEENVTFYKFFTEIKNFLKKLLDDPINAKPSSFFKENDINRSTLLNKLLDRGIINKKENIDEPNDADGKMKSMHYLQYSIPKKNFEQKIKRLYSYFFENEKRKKQLDESIVDKEYNSVATYIFCRNQNGEMCVLAGKRRGRNNGGLYNVPTGLVGDNNYGESVLDAAVREVSEESGINLRPSLFKDVGDEAYSNRYGEFLGKNYAVYLDGVIDEYKPGSGDGENVKFMWIPLSKIDSIPWAFNMNNTIKKITGNEENN